MKNFILIISFFIITPVAYSAENSCAKYNEYLRKEQSEVRIDLANGCRKNDGACQRLNACFLNGGCNPFLIKELSYRYPEQKEIFNDFQSDVKECRIKDDNCNQMYTKATQPATATKKIPINEPQRMQPCMNEEENKANPYSLRALFCLKSDPNTKNCIEWEKPSGEKVL